MAGVRPRIVLGGVSRRIYVATRWHEVSGIVVADEFFDVTDEVLSAVASLRTEMLQERSIAP